MVMRALSMIRGELAIQMLKVQSKLNLSLPMDSHLKKVLPGSLKLESWLKYQVLMVNTIGGRAMTGFVLIKQEQLLTVVL